MTKKGMKDLQEKLKARARAMPPQPYLKDGEKAIWAAVFARAFDRRWALYEKSDSVIEAVAEACNAIEILREISSDYRDELRQLPRHVDMLDDVLGNGRGPGRWPKPKK